MIPFILTISFIIHIITMIVLYQLWLQNRELKTVDHKSIMQTIESSLQEIKAENRLLEEMINKEPETQEKQYVEPRDNIRHVNQYNDNSRQNNVSQTEDEYTLNFKEDVDHVDMSIESKVLQLHEQGLEIEDIAQTMGCGVTEVDLILKFYKNR